MQIQRLLRYGLAEPKKALRMAVHEPHKLVTRSLRYLRRDLLHAHCFYYRKIRHQSGIEIMSQDWDNLIILDACRYDLFKEINPFSGDLSSVISRGADTPEFFERNFAGHKYPDTVYVNANPHLYNVDVEFYDVYHVWQDGWDTSLATVPPSTLTSEAGEIAAEYPNKRLIIHYIQPHYPFIGEVGQDIEHGSLVGDGLISEERDHPTIWEQIRDNTIDRDQAWEAYRENLELTVPHLKDLVNKFTGKTVITSDHGNTFGKWGEYGHRANVCLESMIKVPWLELPFEERKTIITETPLEENTTSQKRIDDRLEALGYK